MHKLKRCPFCKGEPYIVKSYIGQTIDIYCVECKDCFSKTDVFGGISRAVKAWNKRVTDKKTQTQNQSLELPEEGQCTSDRAE